MQGQAFVPDDLCPGQVASYMAQTQDETLLSETLMWKALRSNMPDTVERPRCAHGHGPPGRAAAGSVGRVTLAQVRRCPSRSSTDTTTKAYGAGTRNVKHGNMDKSI